MNPNLMNSGAGVSRRSFLESLGAQRRTVGAKGSQKLLSFLQDPYGTVPNRHHVFPAPFPLAVDTTFGHKAVKFRLSSAMQGQNPASSIQIAM